MYNVHSTRALPSAPNNGAPSYQPDDPNYYYNILTHLSNVSDPNYQANIAAYNKMTGLDVNGRYQAFNAARYMMPLIYLNALNGAQRQQQYQGMSNQVNDAAIQDVMNPSRVIDRNAYENQAANEAGNQQMRQQMLASGFSPDAIANASLASQNRTAAQSNAFRAQTDSYQGRMNRWTAGLQLLANQQPDFSQLAALHQIELGTPRNTSGLEALAGLAGQALGGGLSFKGATNNNTTYSL